MAGDPVLGQAPGVRPAATVFNENADQRGVPSGETARLDA